MAAKKKTELGPKAKLMKKNVDQLKRQAKKLKIQNYSTKKKEQLVNSIMMAEARAKRKPGTKRKTAAKKPAAVKSITTRVTMKGKAPRRRMAAPRRRMNKPMMGEYNGWSNYETWLCNMWYGDSLPMLQEEQEITREHFQDPIYEMSQILESMVEEDVAMATINQSNGFVTDAINNFVREVNYYEIAENQYEE